MKFGVFSVSMPEYSPEKSVELLKELGYTGVEWRVAEIKKPYERWDTCFKEEIPAPSEDDPKIPYEQRYWGNNKSTLSLENIKEEALKAKELCDAAGIEIFGLTTYLAVGDTEKLVNVMEAANTIGCGQVRAGLVPYDPAKAEAPYPVLFDRMREDLKKLDPYARKYNVKVVLEIHMDTMIASPSAAYRALEGFDPEYFGLIFDPGNMVNEGFEEYQKSFELLGDYIAHIHIKNGVLVPDGEDNLGAAKWKRQWCPLKKGMADLKRLFSVMNKFGYDGTVSIEDFSNEEETKVKLENNLAYMKGMAETVKKEAEEAKEKAE